MFIQSEYGISKLLKKVTFFVNKLILFSNYAIVAPLFCMMHEIQNSPHVHLRELTHQVSV